MLNILYITAWQLFLVKNYANIFKDQRKNQMTKVLCFVYFFGLSIDIITSMLVVSIREFVVLLLFVKYMYVKWRVSVKIIK